MEARSPVKHVVRNELHVRSPVLLVEHILEVRSGEHLACVVTRSAPRIKRATYRTTKTLAGIRKKNESIEHKPWNSGMYHGSEGLADSWYE